MGTLAAIPMYIASIGAVVCFVLILIKMFQSGDQTYGIITIVTIFCGVGAFVALILGWMNVGKYNNLMVMIIYTLCLLGAPVFGFFSGLVN